MRWTITLITTVVLMTALLGNAAGEAATQTAVFEFYVPPIVRWLGQTDGADASATLRMVYDPAQPEANEVSETFRLLLNVDVIVQANVTPFTNPDDPSDTLATYWKLDDDGGPDRTGVRFEDADRLQGYGTFVAGRTFLRRGIRVTHRPGDGNVTFTVTARGEKTTGGDDASPKVYEARVVLTVIPQAPAFQRTL